jgi:hypothetical protein
MQDPDQIDDMSGLSELIFSGGAEHPKTGMRTSWGYSGTGWYRYLPLIKYMAVEHPGRYMYCR